MSVVDNILESLPLNRSEVELLLWTAPSRYKVHEIEKRNGRGKRTIAQPTAEIKILQRLMLDRHIARLPISDVATAYRKGIGIANHALAHAPNKYLLKLDFKDFFPSIRGVDFLKHVHKYSDISPEDAKWLTRLFFWRPKGGRNLILSIGAPSSPAISNTVMFDFDNIVKNYCTSKGVIYTRYADDLALSTNQPDVLNDVYKFVVNTCLSLRYPRIELNKDKTVFTSKKHRRQLTGLVLSNDGVASIGRDRKRLLRSMADHFNKGSLPNEKIGTLRGWMAFAMSIDPSFVASVRRMLGDEKFQQLMKT